MSDNGSPTVGLALLCCKRTYIAALSLVHYFAYKTANTRLHVYVDNPKGNEEVPRKLLVVLQLLKDHGFLEDLTVFQDNVGLEGMVTAGVSDVAKKGYDYIGRFEDDMLIGPGLIDMMVEVFEESKDVKRPIGLLGGQVTTRPSSLRPIRFRKVGKYNVGIHGVDNLEGLTLLSSAMEKAGFTWPLSHPKAYNNEWLNKLRKAGFEGGSIVSPTGFIQHIGHRSTVPMGTPVTPARVYGTNEVIRLPVFDWNHFFGAQSEVGEEVYASKVVRQMAANLDTQLAEDLLHMFHDTPDDFVVNKVNYSAPFAGAKEQSSPVFTRHPRILPKVRPVPPQPAPPPTKRPLTAPVKHQTIVPARRSRSLTDF